jgi:quaternary ammonium compound-resistance protein SugE
MSSPWVMLVAAGVLETVWALTLKQTHGFTRLWPSVITLLAMAASFYLLAASIRTIPVGVAYAVWVGIGAAGTWLGSVLIVGEPFRPWHMVWISLIVLSVVMLKTGGDSPASPPAPSVGQS